MPRRTIVTAGLVAAGLGTLLWCAWRIFNAQLTLGTGIAAWALWLVLAAALATAGAYLREVTRHRSSTHAAGWKPLPAVMLLWVAGVSTLAVFAFMLPLKADPAPSGQGAASQALTSASTTSQPTTPGAAPTTAAAAAARASATTASRSLVRPTPAPVQTTAPTSNAVSTASTASPVARSSSSSDAPAPTASPSTSTTTDSLLSGVLFPGHGRTKAPPRN